MKFTTSNKRLFSLLMLGIGIGLAIPLIYHKVTGGTLLGLGIVAESIGFPIVFAIAGCLIECVVSKCVSRESITETSLIQSAPQAMLINTAKVEVNKKLIKPNIVICLDSGVMDIQHDDSEIVPARSGSQPISKPPKVATYRDPTILYLEPTMSLATQKGDNDFLSDSKMQGQRLPLLTQA